MDIGEVEQTSMEVVGKLKCQWLRQQLMAGLPRTWLPEII